MQEMNGGVCSTAQEGEEGKLEDTRDNKIYWIAKLKDGNCWMTQNLDLDLSASKPLLSVDSDLPSSWTPSENTQTSANPNFDTTNNNIKSWNPGANGGEKYCNTSGCNLTTSTNDGHDAQGNYYSWGAATAGQAAKLTNPNTGEQATQSICPKGWRLPTGGSNGEFYVAFNGMTVADLITKPYYFVYGGWIDSSSLLNAGRYGYYWSSTASDASHAYNLKFSASVYPSNDSNRYLGFSVRCVAR